MAIANNAATFTNKAVHRRLQLTHRRLLRDAIYATSTSTATTVTMTAYTGATYTNPLSLTATSGKVYSCPDPAIIKSQTLGSDTWYVYCGGDVLNSVDGKNHLISIYSSKDLINWTYLNDALVPCPAWVQSGQELQQPAIKLINGVYTLYFSATSSARPNGPHWLRDLRHTRWTIRQPRNAAHRAVAALRRRTQRHQIQCGDRRGPVQ